MSSSGKIHSVLIIVVTAVVAGCVIAVLSGLLLYKKRLNGATNNPSDAGTFAMLEMLSDSATQVAHHSSNLTNVPSGHTQAQGPRDRNDHNESHYSAVGPKVADNNQYCYAGQATIQSLLEHDEGSVYTHLSRPTVQIPLHQMREHSQNQAGIAAENNYAHLDHSAIKNISRSSK